MKRFREFLAFIPAMILIPGIIFMAAYDKLVNEPARNARIQGLVGKCINIPELASAKIVERLPAVVRQPATFRVVETDKSGHVSVVPIGIPFIDTAGVSECQAGDAS